MPPKESIVQAVRLASLGLSSILVLISLAIMISERTITAEAWGLLLLAPIPAGFAISTSNKKNDSPNEIVEWAEESDNVSDKSVGDPSESGFDVPVL